MKYTKKDIYEGMKLRCIRTAATKRWRIGGVYTVTKNKIGDVILVDDLGTEWIQAVITDFLNDFGHVYFKVENNMQEFKVGDLVEVIKNDTHTMNEKLNLYKSGDKAIVTEVYKDAVRIGQGTVNMIPKYCIKKLEPTPELTEHEEELVLLLAECIQRKDKCLSQIQQFKNNIKFNEREIDKVSKEIKEITKKLLTK